jgi:hypothetical protein
MCAMAAVQASPGTGGHPSLAKSGALLLNDWHII